METRVRYRLRLLGACLLAACWLIATVSSAVAQPVRTLVVKDGQVILNGKVLSEESYPASLVDAGAELQVQFSAGADPVLSLGGRTYHIAETAIEEIARPENWSGVANRQSPAAPALLEISEQVSVEAFSPALVDLPDARIHVIVPGQDVLAAQALALEQFVTDFEMQPLEGISMDVPVGVASIPSALSRFDAEHRTLLDRASVSDRLLHQAEAMSNLARELPRIQFRTYLNELQRSDAALYERLLREQHLEEQSLFLAQEIRTLPAGIHREARAADLREKLEQIFALKQENRRREIAQLGERLEDLQKRLDMRERLHDDVIDHRMRELLGENPAGN